MIVLFLRPWYWLPILAASIAGSLYATPEVDSIHLALVVLAAASVGAVVEGLNEIADIKIDAVHGGARIGPIRLSGGSGLLARGWLSKVSAYCALGGAAATGLVAALLISWGSLGAVIVAYILGWAYSLPPFRLKRFAAVAFVGHVIGYGPIAVAVGAGVPFVDSRLALWSVAVGLWIGVIGLTADLLDLRRDRSAGIRTMAVLLGSRRLSAAIGVASCILLIGATYFALSGDVPHLALSAVWVLYIPWLGYLIYCSDREPSVMLHVGTLALETVFPFALVL